MPPADSIGAVRIGVARRAVCFRCLKLSARDCFTSRDRAFDRLCGVPFLFGGCSALFLQENCCIWFSTAQKFEAGGSSIGPVLVANFSMMFVVVLLPWLHPSAEAASLSIDYLVHRRLFSILFNIDAVGRALEFSLMDEAGESVVDG